MRVGEVNRQRRLQGLGAEKLVDGKGSLLTYHQLLPRQLPRSKKGQEMWMGSSKEEKREKKGRKEQERGTR